MSIADYGFAIWETFYVTVLSTAFSLVIGLPLGVLLVAGDKDGVLPLPGWLMHVLNIIINILRSVPFLILMICVFPLTRALVGTTDHHQGHDPRVPARPYFQHDHRADHHSGLLGHVRRHWRRRPG